MKQLFVQLAAYNIWANQQLLAIIDALPEEQQKKEVLSSFSSLYKTALHIWDADAVWWQRMRLQERLVVPGDTFTGTMKDLTSNILKQNKEWQIWIGSVQDHVLLHEFIYYNSKKEKFKQPVFQVLQHIFNHATYHRGQLVNILRQLNVKKIPSTDFIEWSRKK